MAKKKIDNFDELNILETNKEFWALTDKAIDALATRTFARFKRFRNKCKGADLLEAAFVLKEAEFLYEHLLTDAEEIFADLGKKQYLKIFPKGKNKPNDSWVRKNIIEEYNTVTKYRFDNESERKQGYLFEAALASPDDIDTTVRKALNLWTRQLTQYAEETGRKAAIQAYEDAGVTLVKWVSEKDEKVCSDCNDLDGTVFEITQIPDTPHHNCRCHLIPVKG